MNVETFPYLSDLAERMSWSCREVLRDVADVPHLLYRVQLTGPHFEARALEPIVRVGRVRADFVELSADGLTAGAYFDRPLPERGAVTFGYEDGVLYRFPQEFEIEHLERLDRERLPENVRFP